MTSTEMDWLKEVLRIADECGALDENRGALSAADRAEPGDVAVHKTLERWPLRMVASGDASQVSLIRLTKKNDRIVFKPDHLVVGQLEK